MSVKNALSAGYSGGSAIVGFDVDRGFIAALLKAAMSLKGHVVITFNVHKDGRITDLTVIRPSDIAAFNNAALNALSQSNPTMQLPPEYPADKAFFTVTFYYNESPGR